MDALRAKAVKQGISSPLPDVQKLHQTFINDISRRGRIHEVRLMAEYNMKKGRLFDNFALGPKMFFKGRLPLLPPRAVKGFKDWMGRIWKRKN
jgi:heterodisulfide reductase subunit C